MSELIQETLHEITANPLLFAVEVVQFLILIVIIGFILRRVLGTVLRDRRERIAAEVAKADHADTAYAEAQERAAALVEEAREEARRTIERARSTAQEERRAGLDQAEQDAQTILRQARQTIETEKSRVAGEASEELVTLIIQVIRRFIDEALSESERKAVTQKLVLTSLKEMTDTASQQ
jgi:F-type H+-transporting ATPase subunit b